MNGRDAVRAGVSLHMQDLKRESPAALLALILLAHTPSWPITEDAAVILRERALIEADGRMHDLTREIVLELAEP